MRRLAQYISEYKKETILAPLFKLTEACFDLFVPLVVASMIDSGAAVGRAGWVWLCFCALAALSIVGLSASYTAQYFAAKAATGFASKVRRALYRKIVSFSFEQVDSFGSDTLSTRITSDVDQVQSGLNLTLRLLTRSPFVVFGATIMAFVVDARSGLVFLAALPTLAAIVILTMKATIPLYRRLQSRLDDLGRLTRETLSGARTIRAFNMTDSERDAFFALALKYFRAQRAASAASGIMSPIATLVVNAGLAALIWQGAARVQIGDLTQGQTIALLNYMAQILVELIKLANLTVQINKSFACGSRIVDVLSSPEESDGGDRDASAFSVDTAIEFDNVSFAYPGSPRMALEKIAFSAKRGDTICVLGGSGSGKSTLVNLIPRFYEATEGTIKLFGVPIGELTRESLRGSIAYAPQKPELFRGDVASNLRWGDAEASEESLWSALETAQARDFVASKPGGLHYELEQNGRNLSGGQRQRLGIARALVKKAPILILDDATSALDYATDANLRAALRGRRGDQTIFLVSQRASAALDADLTLVIDGGRLVGAGAHRDLVESNEVYREIYYSQYPKDGGDAAEEGAE